MPKSSDPHATGSRAATLLDAAGAAREVGIIVALALIQAEGDPLAAALILDEAARVCPAEGDELDCSTIGAQAIREAVGLRDA